MRKLNLFFPLIISFLLLSCNGQVMHESEADIYPTSSDPLQTSTSVPATPTATSEISSQTATHTNVPPNLTPLPPIPTEEIPFFVSELLETNRGCRLPCLWGIVPGETPWAEAYQFLSTFSIVGRTSDYQTGYALAKVNSPIEIEHIGSITYSFRVVDGMVESIDFYNWPELYSWHSLPNILNEYGPPDEVALHTEGEQRNGSRIAMLVLFYEDPGFMIDYVSFRELKAVGDSVLFCPAGNYSIMYLWSKALNYSFDEAVSVFIEPYSSISPRPILEVSDMDIQSFYHTFQDPDTDACIETGLEAWPHFLD